MYCTFCNVYWVESPNHSTYFTSCFGPMGRLAMAASPPIMPTLSWMGTPVSMAAHAVRNGGEMCVYIYSFVFILLFERLLRWPQSFGWPNCRPTKLHDRPQPSTQGWAVIIHVQGGCLSARTAQNHPMYLFLHLLLRQKGFQRLHLFSC